jgi:hypothetical protein
VLLLRCGLRKVDGVGELLYRQLGVLRGEAAYAVAHAHKHVCHRIYRPVEQPQRLREGACHLYRVALREYLGHDLAEEQQQERHDHGLEQKLVHAAEAEYGIDQIRGQYDDADVYQIVDYEYGRQQPVYVVQQGDDRAAGRVALRFERVDIGTRQ